MPKSDVLLPDTFPATAVSGMVCGPAGVLEVQIDVPEAEHSAVAIVCHPHPLHGGSMNNKVVTMIERSLRELGLATVRFNFRGVGASQGEYDDGNGETDDLLAIAQWVRQSSPQADLWLAGFSFGAYVAGRAAALLPLTQLIMIAPPVSRWDFDQIRVPAIPWLVVQGEDDEIVDSGKVFAWVDSLSPPPNLVRMPQTGHFFHRRLMDLRGALKNALRANLPAANTA